MAQRVKTSLETAEQFKKSFADKLGARLDPPQRFPPGVPNEILCQIYDNLSHSQKRGIWPEVAKEVGRDEKWAAKHYLNSFRRALYPENLTSQHKEQITDLTKRLWARHYDKRSIVDEAKAMFAATKIFPDAVQSYVFQTIVRIQHGQIQMEPRGKDLFPRVLSEPKIISSSIPQSNQVPPPVPKSASQSFASEPSEETKNLTTEFQKQNQLDDGQQIMMDRFRAVLSAVPENDKLATLSKFVFDTYQPFQNDYADEGGF